MLQHRRTTNILLSIIALVMVSAVLKAKSTLFIPPVLALFCVATLQPVMRWCNKYVPRAATIPVLILLLAAVLFADTLVFFVNFKAFAAKAPFYADKLQALVSKVVAFLTEHGFPLEQENLQSKQMLQWALGYASAGVSSLMNLFGQVTLILFLVIFLILEIPHFSEKLDVGFGPKLSHEMKGTLLSISERIQEYSLTKTLISILTGLVTYFITYFMGVDFAAFWGILAFLLNFIPNIGPIIAVIPPVLVALLQFSSPMPAVYLTLLLGTTHTLSGNVVEPRIMGEELNLSTFVVFLSMIYWGWAWGIIGLVLAVPLTVALKIVMEHFESLRPLAILLGATAKQCESPHRQTSSHKQTTEVEEEGD
ncbi:MAG: AI-2E family transporter [Deltaproteobacteria bacterium]|nr:MAG: AI-2E family transporter [Deltaproteobacteria bacterium]